jgi:nitrogenase-stabilizing/protective protein
MSATTLPAGLRDLATAEEYLEFFDLPYDPAVVQVKRLHILQRFHDYLAHADIPEDDEGAALVAIGNLLARAYADFVRSTPLQERVFKVLKNAQNKQLGNGRVFVPLSAIAKRPEPPKQ